MLTLINSCSALKSGVTCWTSRRYCWPVSSLDDLKLAPFHILATEGAAHINRDHGWHMDTLARVCSVGEELLIATKYIVVDVTDPDSVPRTRVCFRGPGPGERASRPEVVERKRVRFCSRFGFSLHSSRCNVKGCYLVNSLFTFSKNIPKRYCFFLY